LLAHGWQTISERCMVRSREPFKFLWAPAISLKRLIVSGTVNLVRPVSVCHKLLMVVGQLLITPTVKICIQQLGQVEEMV